MVVQIRKGALNYFRKRARANRNEILGLLVGQRLAAHKVRVDLIWYPELALSTPMECAPEPESWKDLHEIAEDNGLRVIGTIHSHPGSPAYMSPTDLRSHRDCGELVSGIVEITGEKKRTRVAFWQGHTAVPCSLEYI